MLGFQEDLRYIWSYLIVLYSRKPVPRYWSPLPIGTNPELWVDLVLGDEFTSQDVAHKEIVVHCIRNDLSHG